MPGLGISSREWNSYSLLNSGLENSMDCIVHGVAKSQTWHFRVQHGCVILSIGIFAWTVLHRVSFPDFMCRLPCPEDKKRCLLYLRAENYHPPIQCPSSLPIKSHNPAGSQAYACRTSSLICKAKDKMKVQDSLLKVKISRCR